jgi:hypothetical protein
MKLFTENRAALLRLSQMLKLAVVRTLLCALRTSNFVPTINI